MGFFIDEREKYGVIPYISNLDKIILVSKNSDKKGDYGFAKGSFEEDKDDNEFYTASREGIEETGILKEKEEV